MRKTLATCSLFALTLLAATAAKADTCSANPYNLVANCGFETGDFTGWSGTSTMDASGNYNYVQNYDVYQGNYAANLAAATPVYTSATTLSQTFATTPGQQYTIQFALDEYFGGYSTGYPNSFAADFGASVLFSESNVGLSPFVLYSFNSIATGSSTTLSFVTFNDAGSFDLDNVSVTPTPEPSSLILLGTGLAGAVAAARRRLRV